MKSIFRDIKRNVTGKLDNMYCGIFRVKYRFPQHFVLYLGNLNYFLNIVNQPTMVLSKIKMSSAF